MSLWLLGVEMVVELELNICQWLRVAQTSTGRQDPGSLSHDGSDSEINKVGQTADPAWRVKDRDEYRVQPLSDSSVVSVVA